MAPPRPAATPPCCAPSRPPPSCPSARSPWPPAATTCPYSRSACSPSRSPPPADPGRAGLAVGAAGALKLFAWPIALVLLFWAATRRATLRTALGALGLPVLALVPVLLVDRDALVENVLRFPLGHGLVTSPAQSPFPGHLIAETLPAGRAIAAALLVAAGLAIAVRLLRRPPRTAATTTIICGYGLLAAILLMPSTRFGYLLYPAALLVLAPALALTRPADPTAFPATAPRDAAGRRTPEG